MLLLGYGDPEGNAFVMQLRREGVEVGLDAAGPGNDVGVEVDHSLGSFPAGAEPVFARL